MTTPAERVGCEKEYESIEGLGATDIEIGYLTGCRLNINGEWFVPTSQDDDRLVDGPILDENEKNDTWDARLSILSQLNAFLAWIDTEAYDGSQSMLDALEAFQASGEVYQPNSWPGLRTGYEDRLLIQLESPDSVALRDYVYWRSSRRVFVVDKICRSLAPMFCQSLENKYLSAPWPWELQDGFTLAEYLDWALANGRITPSSVNTPAPSEENEGLKLLVAGSLGCEINRADGSVNYLDPATKMLQVELLGDGQATSVIVITGQFTGYEGWIESGCVEGAQEAGNIGA